MAKVLSDSKPEKVSIVEGKILMIYSENKHILTVFKNSNGVISVRRSDRPRPHRLRKTALFRATRE